MKRSVSAPNLTSSRNSLLPPLKLRKSVSVNALPVDMSLSPLDMLGAEIQVEAVFHVTGIQAGQCALNAQAFPGEVLLSNASHEDLNSDSMDLAACLICPSDVDPPPSPVFQRPTMGSATYFSTCEASFDMSRRYYALLKGVRNNRRKNKNCENPDSSCDVDDEPESAPSPVV